MPPNINVTTAFLAGLITFSLFYGEFFHADADVGVYFVFFMGSLYVLLYRKLGGRVNYIILGGIILQFVLITTCYGIRWDRIYTAFIVNGGTPDGPLLFLTRLDDWRELSSSVLWVVTGVLGDIMLMYRLYVVWDRRLQPCLVPLALLMGSLATAIGLISLLGDPVMTTYTAKISRWVYAFLSFNLVQNVLVNVLIIIRIWRTNTQSALSIVGTSLWPIIVIFMESGVLYSSSVLALLLTYACRNNIAMIMTDAVLPVMGIAFNLIIVRAGLASSNDDGTRRDGASSSIVFVHPSNVIAHPLTYLIETAESPPEEGKKSGTLDHH